MWNRPKKGQKKGGQKKKKNLRGGKKKKKTTLGWQVEKYQTQINALVEINDQDHQSELGVGGKKKKKLHKKKGGPERGKTTVV